jgi:hypothetical protein
MEKSILPDLPDTLKLFVFDLNALRWMIPATIPIQIQDMISSSRRSKILWRF